jgi:chromosome segregation ATPase
MRLATTTMSFEERNFTNQSSGTGRNPSKVVRGVGRTATGRSSKAAPAEQTDSGRGTPQPKDNIVYTLQEKLREAEAKIQALDLLVAPVEQVRAQLNAEKRKCGEAERLMGRWEVQCSELMEQAAYLEAGEMDAQRKAERAQMETSQLEYSCTLLGAHAHTATTELEEAKRIEQELAVKRLNLTLAHAEAENAHARAEIHAQDNLLEVQALYRAHNASQLQVGETRGDLFQIRCEAGASASQLQRLMWEHERLRADHEEQHAILSDAVAHSSALASRNEYLEAELTQARSLVALESSRGMAVVGASKNALVALEDFPTTTAPVSSVPASPSAAAQSTLSDPLWPPRSPYRSPRSRCEYPRSGFRRHLRKLEPCGGNVPTEYERP